MRLPVKKQDHPLTVAGFAASKGSRNKKMQKAAPLLGWGLSSVAAFAAEIGECSSVLGLPVPLAATPLSSGTCLAASVTY